MVSRPEGNNHLILADARLRARRLLAHIVALAVFESKQRETNF